MTTLPEPPAAPAAGQAANPLTDAVIQAAVENAIQKARRHDTTPEAVIGTAPPVPQPGRPPMSQKATDASALMLSGGVATVLAGGSASLVLAASGIADPTVVGIIAAAPVAVAVPIWAVTRMLKGIKHTVPDVHHHHYNAPVDQRTQQTKTSGLWARTNNQQ